VKGTVVIGGALAQKPRQAGHTWQFLQYLLGFRRLGWDVLFLDRLEPEMCVDETGAPCSPDDSVNLAYLREVLAAFGLGDRFAVLWDGGRRCLGVPRAHAFRRVREAALFLNVMGFVDDEEVLAAAPLSVFLDTDPGFSQMWYEAGLADLYRGHDRYVTIAENIGRAECVIPACGLDWITTAQPVVMDAWCDGEGRGARFTSVGAWRGPYAPVEHRGTTYGLRAHEFRKFAGLPRVSGRSFEVALDIHPAETRDLELLAAGGWRLVEPRAVASDPWTYREYIQGSLAEFMVAKGMYVQTRSGWFSERSICYLASGKPVLAQDTGLADLYPTGEGLVTFTTLEEAVAGADAICGDYRSHSNAARELAREHFDSDRVLTRLLEALGVA
jgi:hypothetical protein